MAGVQKWTKLTQCEPNGSIIRNVWINKDYVIWCAMNNMVTTLMMVDGHTVNVVESPETMDPSPQATATENPPEA